MEIKKRKNIPFSTRKFDFPEIKYLTVQRITLHD